MMGRTHCVVPVGIAAWLCGPDPGPIIVAGSARVLPNIDEIISHMGYRVWQFFHGFRWRIGLQNSTHSFGGVAGAVMLACVVVWSRHGSWRG